MPQSDVGRRVRLVKCTDPHTKIEPGTEGVVQFVDSLGTYSVKWDDGHHLGLIPDEDVWTFIPTTTDTEGRDGS